MISRLKMEIFFTFKKIIIFPNYQFCQVFKIDVETIRVKIWRVVGIIQTLEEERGELIVKKAFS